MFEIGFSELLLISVIALVVLGPERLPRLLAQLGRWAGRARSMARSFREQLESEVNLEDLAKTPPPKPAPPPPPPWPPGDTAAAANAGEQSAPPDLSVSDSLATAHLTPADAPAASAYEPGAVEPVHGAAEPGLGGGAEPAPVGSQDAGAYEGLAHEPMPQPAGHHPEAEQYGAWTPAAPARKPGEAATHETANSTHGHQA